MAHNWICSAEKVGLRKNLYLVAFEDGVCSQLPKDIPCYQHPGAHYQSTVFSEPEYQKLMIERTRLILKLLSCTSKLALVDADITFLKNPLPYLNALTDDKDPFTEDKDIVFQADSTRVKFLDNILPRVFDYRCGGFIFMKTNYAVRQLWLSVLKYQEEFLWNDQAGLNICIRHYTQTVRWDTLDSKKFPNGQQFFAYGERSSESMIVHANHLEGKEKIVRMISADVWCYTPVAVEMCNGTAYETLCSASDSMPEWCPAFQQVCANRYGIVIQ